MSLRWIQENKEAPTCDEESSDIDDSATDDSYDTDSSLDKNDNENSVNQPRKKRNTTRHPTTTVIFDENGFVFIEIYVYMYIYSYLLICTSVHKIIK